MSVKGSGTGLVQAVLVRVHVSKYAVVPCADWDMQACNSGELEIARQAKPKKTMILLETNPPPFEKHSEQVSPFR